MNVLVIVPEELLLLLIGLGPDRLLNVPGGIFGTNHETNLPRGVCWDSGVGVLDNGEDLAARLLKFGDKLQVKPLVLGCRAVKLVSHMNLPTSEGGGVLYQAEGEKNKKNREE